MTDDPDNGTDGSDAPDDADESQDDGPKIPVTPIGIDDIVFEIEETADQDTHKFDPLGQPLAGGKIDGLQAEARTSNMRDAYDVPDISVEFGGMNGQRVYLNTTAIILAAKKAIEQSDDHTLPDPDDGDDDA